MISQFECACVIITNVLMPKTGEAPSPLFRKLRFRQRQTLLTRILFCGTCCLQRYDDLEALNFLTRLDALLNKPNVFQLKLNIFLIKTSSSHFKLETLQKCFNIFCPRKICYDFHWSLTDFHWSSETSSAVQVWSFMNSFFLRKVTDFKEKEDSHL